MSYIHLRQCVRALNRPAQMPMKRCSMTATWVGIPRRCCFFAVTAASSSRSACVPLPLPASCVLLLSIYLPRLSLVSLPMRRATTRLTPNSSRSGKQTLCIIPTLPRARSFAKITFYEEPVRPPPNLETLRLWRHILKAAKQLAPLEQKYYISHARNVRPFAVS